jgi:hypothetical protein
MKKIVITGILLLTICLASFARIYTISTPCGYFTGTAEECGEYLEICLEEIV